MTDYEAPAPTPDYDELLRLFTSKPGGHFKITLLVGGTWISGRAVSAAEWFDQEFGTSSDAAGLKDRVFGQEGEAADESLNMIEYLHLFAAKSYTGTDAGVPKNGLALRIPLTSIDGWCLGGLVKD